MSDIYPGDVISRARLLTENFETGVRRVNSLLREVREEHRRTTGELREMANASSTVLLRAGLVGGGLIGLAVKQAAAFEMTRSAFTTLLKDGDAAKSMLADLQQFAKVTPFQFTDLTRATRQLLAYGFTAKEITPLLTTLGDTVAAFGGGTDLFGRVIMALGQMRAKQMVSGEEMRQLAEAGIPAWQLVANAIGVTVPEAMARAENKTIDFNTAFTGLIAGLKSQFGGAMDAMAQTTAGRWSNLVDKLTILAITAGDKLLPAVNQLIDGVSGFADVVAKADPAILTWVTGMMLAAGAIIKVTLGITQWKANMSMITLAQQQQTAALAQQDARILVYTQAVNAQATAQMRAATTAFEEAIALQELAATQAGMTPADLAFADAEHAKAAAALRAAGAFQQEAIAQQELAMAQGKAAAGAGLLTRVAGVLNPVLLAVGIGAAGVGAAFAIMDAAIDRQTNKLRAEADALDALVGRRKEAVNQLRTLGQEYDKLATSSTLTAEEQAKLKAVKAALLAEIKAVSKELGIQPGQINDLTTAWQKLAEQQDAKAKEEARKAEITKGESDVAALEAERRKTFRNKYIREFFRPYEMYSAEEKALYQQVKEEKARGDIQGPLGPAVYNRLVAADKDILAIDAKIALAKKKLADLKTNQKLGVTADPNSPTPPPAGASDALKAQEIESRYELERLNQAKANTQRELVDARRFGRLGMLASAAGGDVAERVRAMETLAAAQRDHDRDTAEAQTKYNEAVAKAEADADLKKDTKLMASKKAQLKSELDTAIDDAVTRLELKRIQVELDIKKSSLDAFKQRVLEGWQQSMADPRFIEGQRFKLAGFGLNGLLPNPLGNLPTPAGAAAGLGGTINLDISLATTDKLEAELTHTIVGEVKKAVVVAVKKLRN